MKLEIAKRKQMDGYRYVLYSGPYTADQFFIDGLEGESALKYPGQILMPIDRYISEFDALMGHRLNDIE